jgi:hypothetical protein
VRRKQTPILPDSAMFDMPESYRTTFNNELFLARDILVYRLVQNLGLSTNYMNNIDICTCIQKRMALALLPLDTVQMAFLNSSIIHTNSFTDLHNRLNHRIQRSHPNI